MPETHLVYGTTHQLQIIKTTISVFAYKKYASKDIKMIKKLHYKLSAILLIVLTLAVSLAQAETDSMDTNQIQQEIDLRISIGFRSDLDYVRSLHQSDSTVYPSRAGGIALTHDEAQELQSRIALEQDGETLRKFFAETTQLQDAFGGIYIEHATGSEDHTVGGNLILQLVPIDNHNAESIVAMLPALQFPERLAWTSAEYSNNHLVKQFEHISNNLGEHSALQGVSIARKENRVEVLIATSGETERTNGSINKTDLPEDLAQLVADPSIVVLQGVVKNNLEAVRGGESWSNTSGGSNCTLGFKVKHNNTYSMLTAGHCITDLGMSSGANVYHNSTHIGTFSGASEWGSSSVGLDAAVLHMNGQSTAYDDVKYYSSSNYDVVGSTSTYVSGYWRCWAGMNSGTKCGTITCESSSYVSGGKTYTDVFMIDPTGQAGDSGGPAYRAELYNMANVTGTRIGTATGNLSCMNGDDSNFNKWHRIRDHFNLTLVTNG